MEKRKNFWLVSLACAIAAFTIHLPVLRAGFVWDDDLVQVYQLPRLHSIADAFRPPADTAGMSGQYYRPLVTLSYLAENKANTALHGEAASLLARRDPARAALPHGITLGLHVAAAFLFPFLARRCLADTPGAAWGTLAAGLVFALLPLHVENVATIAGRSDILATLFLLAGLLAALSARDRGSLARCGGAALLFFCALLSKETALAGMILLPLCFWLVPPRDETAPDRRGLERNCAVFFALAAFLYFGLRLLAGVGLGVAAPEASPENVFGAAALYLRKIFFPWPLSPYIAELPGPLETVALFAGGAVLAFFAHRLRMRGEKLCLFGLLWLGAALVPALLVAATALAATPAAERYLYLPSAGFALCVGGLAARGAQTRWRHFGWAALGALLAAYAVTSWRGTALWQSDLSLWSEVVEQPAAARQKLPWVNLGSALYEAGRLEEAERAYRKAREPGMKADPTVEPDAANGLGLVCYDRAMDDFGASRWEEAAQLFGEAEGYFGEAARSGGWNWAFARNLGQTHLMMSSLARARTGRYDRRLLELARRDLTAALRLSPGNPELLALLEKCDGRLSSPEAR